MRVCLCMCVLVLVCVCAGNRVLQHFKPLFFVFFFQLVFYISSSDLWIPLRFARQSAYGARLFIAKDMLAGMCLIDMAFEKIASFCFKNGSGLFKIRSTYEGGEFKGSVSQT